MLKPLRLAHRALVEPANSNRSPQQEFSLQPLTRHRPGEDGSETQTLKSGYMRIRIGGVTKTRPYSVIGVIAPLSAMECRDHGAS